MVLKDLAQAFAAREAGELQRVCLARSSFCSNNSSFPTGLSCLWLGFLSNHSSTLESTLDTNQVVTCSCLSLLPKTLVSKPETCTEYTLTFLIEAMPDFLAAAHRHFDDGDILHNQLREAHAVQLWAYGAECTLKAIAVKQGHTQIDSKGKPNNKFGQHLNQADPSVPDLLSLYNASQSGTSALMGPQTAFVGWEISARYEDGSQLQPVAQYAQDASVFRSLLNAATLQGLLT